VRVVGWLELLSKVGTEIAIVDSATNLKQQIRTASPLGAANWPAISAPTSYLPATALFSLGLCAFYCGNVVSGAPKFKKVFRPVQCGPPGCMVE
jgi:hypothetical protein